MDVGVILGLAAAARTGWKLSNTIDLPEHGLVLGLCQGWHETRCGLAWPLTNNVGAATLRALDDIECSALAGAAAGMLPTDEAGLSGRGEYVEFARNPQRFLWVDSKTYVRRTLDATERSFVASITPSVGKGHEDKAREAERWILTADIERPHGQIHCDSAPGLGAYFVWFATFPTPAEGFQYYWGIVAGRPGRPPKPARAVLLAPGSSEDQFARALYYQHYYTGFHDPKALMADGRSGAEHNIDEYAAALRQLRPQIQGILAGTIAPDHVVRRSIRLGSFGPDVAIWEGVLANDTKPDTWKTASGEQRVWRDEWMWPIVPDEAFDERTAAATECWQARHGLKADGWVGPATWTKAA